MMKLENIHQSYKPILHILETSSFKNFSDNILKNISFQPKEENVFEVLKIPVKDIKVVILGLDPYTSPDVAIGRAFAVSETTKVPVSLRIIMKEIDRTISSHFDFDNPKFKTLQHWQDQGVMLLNTALTVETGKTNSHLKYWEVFSKYLIQFISESNKDIIFVLWGKTAQIYKIYIKDNIILESAHPAAESYNPKNKFVGNDHFLKINKILVEKGKLPINW